MQALCVRFGHVAFSAVLITASLAAPHAPNQVRQLMLAAFAKAFDDTFLIVVALSVVGTLLGLTLRRNYAAQAAQPPAPTKLVTGTQSPRVTTFGAPTGFAQQCPLVFQGCQAHGCAWAC